MSTADPGPGLDRDIKLSAALRRGEALLAAGAPAAAADAAAAAFQGAARAGMQARAAAALLPHRAPCAFAAPRPLGSAAHAPRPALPLPRGQAAATSALLLLGEAHLAAGDPAGALPHALSGGLHCQQLGLAALAPRAALLAAQLWHALAPPGEPGARGERSGGGGAGAALRLLRGALPAALAQRDLAAAGRLRAAAAEVALGELDDLAGDAGDAGDQGEGGCGGDAAAAALRDLAAAGAALEATGSWRGAARAWRLLALALHARGGGGAAAAARDAAAARALACERGAWAGGGGGV